MLIEINETVAMVFAVAFALVMILKRFANDKAYVKAKDVKKNPRHLSNNLSLKTLAKVSKDEA